MNRATVTVVLMTGLAATTVNAQQASTTDAAQLRTELDQLRARIDELEGTGADERSISFSGDLRYRHDTISDETATTDRSRHRIRARFNVSADPAEDLEVGFTLATGASNPVSANQSFDGGFTRKDIGVDRAWFAWDINDDLQIKGGKMENPLFRPAGHHLIFDSDLNPEGLALRYDGNRVFANVGGFWVEERGSADDAILYALQGGYRAMIGAEGELTLGASYLNYVNTRGYEPFYLGEPQGNSVDLAGNLLYDFDIVELYAQYEMQAGEHPLRLFIDYAENKEAGDYDTGFAVGARWRRASAPGTWDMTWAYQDLEADAVIATFTDSDFRGGGTDTRGHELKATYVLRDSVRLNGSYFMNEVDIDAGNAHDYDRVLLDINFSF